jgi:phage-related protein
MDLAQQINICSEHYQKWKDTAIRSTDKAETRKALERAFFWAELQSAFIVLHALERVAGNDKNAQRKLLIAKSNLSKKLMDYAKEILNEI